MICDSKVVGVRVSSRLFLRSFAKSCFYCCVYETKNA